MYGNAQCPQRENSQGPGCWRRWRISTFAAGPSASRSWFLALSVFWSAASRGAAQELGESWRPSFAPPRAASAKASTRLASPSRRFIVTGGMVDENADMTAAAEDALRRMEQVLGFAVPFSKMDPIRIALARDAGMESGRVVFAQAWVDRQLIQRVTVTNPERADQEELLEVLSRFALARHVIAEQSSEERQAALASVPDWFAVGLAQNLYVALRTRNAAIMLEAWRQGRAPSWAEVLEMDFLPDGRWGEKAAAGLAVGLLADQPDRVQLFRRLLALAKRGRTITPALLSSVDPFGRSPVNWEKEWDIWIASQDRVVRLEGVAERVRFENLENELTIRPLDLGIPEQAGIPSKLTPNELAEMRYESWAAPVATLVAYRIRAAGIGRSRAFWDVAEAYADYFEAIAACHTHGWWRRTLGRRSIERKLRGLWESAEEKRKEYFAGARGHPEAPATGEDVGADRDAEMRRFLPRSERLRWMDQMRAQRP